MASGYFFSSCSTCKDASQREISAIEFRGLWLAVVGGWTTNQRPRFSTGRGGGGEGRGLETRLLVGCRKSRWPIRNRLDKYLTWRYLLSIFQVSVKYLSLLIQHKSIFWVFQVFFIYDYLSSILQVSFTGSLAQCLHSIFTVSSHYLFSIFQNKFKTVSLENLSNIFQASFESF